MFTQFVLIACHPQLDFGSEVVLAREPSLAEALRVMAVLERAGIGSVIYGPGEIIRSDAGIWRVRLPKLIEGAQ